MKKAKIFTTSIALMLFAAGLPAANLPEGWERTYDLSHVMAVILTGGGFHDAEAMIPMAFLQQRGARVTVAGPKRGTVTAYNSNHTLEIEKAAGEIKVQDFNLLILPGGQAPQRIREDANVVRFAREFFMTSKPVAAICHGPQVLVTAGVLAERTATCFPGMSAEINNARGTYVDRPVAVDRNLITSRVPGDIPDFCVAIALALVREKPDTQ
jgi:protease I